MNLELDKIKLSKLILEQVDRTTCLQCCKSYIAPATALCGHSLCHTCWRGHRTCPTCTKPLDRKTLKLNLPLQTLTGHIQVLTESFEKLFSIKLDEFILESPGEFQSEKDKNKHVKDWLANSENQFSAPLSQESVQDILKPPNPLEVSASNIQVHTHSKKSTSPPKVIHIPAPPQDDWDKIEPMPDTEVNLKNKENIVGPMDIEPFYIDDNEYTLENPRRSSRKRELNSDVSGPKSNVSIKLSSKDSGLDNEKKSEKAKQTWHNVKKMRKEFSKLNKQNRNKLNVSIEMVKKTQNLKPPNTLPAEVEQVYNIDDRTPIANKDHDIHETDIQNIDMNEGKSLQKYVTDEVMERNEVGLEDHVVNDLQTDNATVQKYTDKIMEDTVKVKHAVAEASTVAIQNKDSEICNENIPSKMPFVKKGALLPKNEEISVKVQDDNNELPPSANTDDIEITIKIGTTITNIVIKKKENDVQVKVHTDRGIQTSLGDNGLPKDQSLHNNTVINENIDKIKTCESTKNPPFLNISLKSQDQSNKNLNNTTSVKKNTASAETATAQFEITESVEKELSNIMECEEIIQPQPSVSHSVKKNTLVNKKLVLDKNCTNDKNMDDICIGEDINDLDIFGSGSIKEASVKILSNPAPSEILISTVQNKFRTQKQKRDREGNSDESIPSSKKLKITQKEHVGQENLVHDSEPINYDAVMDQVFANIDADIEDIRKSQQNLYDKESNINKSETIVSDTQSNKNKQDVKSVTKMNESLLQKHSENVFSMIDKEDEKLEANTDVQMPQQVEDLLTPVLCRNFNTLKDTEELNKTGKSRRKSHNDCDDSDKSVVEETPQKNMSYSKLKRASTTNKNVEQSPENLTETKMIPLKNATENMKSIINITDTLADNSKSNNDVTIVDVANKKHTLETPLTITKFADQIKHKSTPVARKSLHFDNENLDDNDPEQTLCPSSVIAKTTQEKEFLFNAFEKTPTRVTRPLAVKKPELVNNKRFCLAGSCLSASDITKLKYLCSERNWSYVDKYTDEITHLVVGVDEENKSQRSVKYMCALAASKWIVSFEWVRRCLVAKTVLDETPFEALDSTGEAGPRRSRTARQKLFEGITFYCMPPYSVLDVDTLKSMLTAAGGRVASELKQVRVSGESMAPALLLAEPEHTQEDRFIYLTMELQVVPVNFEWVLNCLGSYMLGSVQELLLCPSALLPPATANWPEVLFAQEYD